MPTLDYDDLISSSYEAPTVHEREAATRELKKAGNAALPALEKRLADPRWQARRHVAQLLDDALDNTTVHVLMRALTDTNAVVRRNTLHSLVCETCKPQGCWTVDTTGVLLRLIAQDRSPRVRIAAMRYLSNRPPEQRSVETLRAVLATHAHRLVRTVAQGLQERLEQALSLARPADG